VVTFPCSALQGKCLVVVIVAYTDYSAPEMPLEYCVVRRVLLNIRETCLQRESTLPVSKVIATAMWRESSKPKLYEYVIEPKNEG